MILEREDAIKHTGNRHAEFFYEQEIPHGDYDKIQLIFVDVPKKPKLLAYAHIHLRSGVWFKHFSVVDEGERLRCNSHDIRHIHIRQGLINLAKKLIVDTYLLAETEHFVCDDADERNS